MSILKACIKALKMKKNKITNLDVFIKSFDFLSHDLKNNFIAIQANVGNIKHCISTSEVEKMTSNIEKSLTGIHKKINHSIVLLNTMGAIIRPTQNRELGTEAHSIIDSIQKAIQSYPFSSDKHSSYIKIIPPAVDFPFYGNIQLLNTVFYCLIKNVLRNMDCANEVAAKAIIEISNQKVCFKFLDQFKNLDQSDYDLFTLGLPKRPGNGFLFITQALKGLNGGVDFKQENNGKFSIDIFFTT